MTPRLLPLAALTLAVLAGCAAPTTRTTALPDGSKAQVAILETTDIHSNVLSYDYYKQREDDSMGYRAHGHPDPSGSHAIPQQLPVR